MVQVHLQAAQLDPDPVRNPLCPLQVCSFFLFLSMLGQVEKSFKKLVMQPNHDWRIPHDRILKVICLITGPIIGFGSKLRLVHKHAA